MRNVQQRHERSVAEASRVGVTHRSVASVHGENGSLEVTLSVGARVRLGLLPFSRMG